MASDAKHAILAFDVSACFSESKNGWRGAHAYAWCVRVERALHARVLVCKAQGSECG